MSKIVFIFAPKLNKLLIYMNTQLDFHYQVTFRVNPICGKRKVKTFDCLYDATEFLLECAEKNLNPSLTVKL